MVADEFLNGYGGERQIAANYALVFEQAMVDSFHIFTGESEHGQKKTGFRRTLDFLPAFEHIRRGAPGIDELQKHFQLSAANHVHSGHFGVRHVEGDHHGTPQ